MISRFIAVSAILGCLTAADFDHEPARVGAPDKLARLRRPVALVLADNGQWLFVANARAGSISIIDTAQRRVVGETLVGKKISDLVATPDGQYLLAVDEEANELLVLARHGKIVAILSRLAISPSPVNVRVNADGSRCAVASLWSRRLTVVDLTALAKNKGTYQPKVIHTVDLPFAPRKQIFLPNGKLIVAASFGGQLAVIDVERGKLEAVRSFAGNNIRGLALNSSGDHLLVSQQILHPIATSTFDDIHWGNLITNNIRSLSVTAILNPRQDISRDNVVNYLGDVNSGAGDPADVCLTPAGVTMVALSGVGEIALGQESKGEWKRLKVGQRPTALVSDPMGQWAYVANTFADSVSVVDVKQKKVAAEISLGTPALLTARDRGELLFYDARLAHDRWLSCHSCHTDGHTSGLLNDNLSDGTLGTPKRILTLLGARDTPPYAWNGGMPDLESQIRKSIQVTMQGPKPTEGQVGDLAEFLRSLTAAPSLDRLRGNLNEAAVGRGSKIFNSQGCAGCHEPPEYTSRKTYRVGLQDEAGMKDFNPPSLRGVSQGGPYFHDNRAATLEEVVGKFQHQLTSVLSAAEAKDLVQFLRSL